MKLLELTLPTAAENVALDEALLESAETGEGGEVLRIWAPTQTMVVIGRSSQIEVEVDRARCADERVPIIRRTSGGLAIVAGTGCLVYSVILNTERRPELQAIDQAHCFVLERILKAVRSLGIDAVCQGSSDLTVGDRKFSGNSLRCRRNHLLYHGTLLNHFPLDKISRLLTAPPRQPEYRNRRKHDDFVTNLGLDSNLLSQAIIDSWVPSGRLESWPEPLMRRFVAERYSQDSWNARR